MADQEEGVLACNPLPAPAQAPQAPQGQQLVHLYWSYFEPEFSGKPDEDTDAHLLCTNDWMNAHHFINHYVDWQGLQNLFSQQYSKIGNTRELLFHARRSFYFDENTESIDAYVTCLWQVAALLGYGEPQILEVFKNTLPTKLYCILFPIEDLRQVVEIAKRILTKES